MVKSPNKNKGLTLIEVLVSMIILAIGLLGLAGLQANGLRNNNNAYLRTQATLLAYDMSDKIKSNREALMAGAFDDFDTTSGSGYTEGETAACTEITGCNSTAMAQTDLHDWEGDVEYLLPSGSGSVAYNAATKLVTIDIQWLDRMQADTTKTFTTSFRP